MSNNFSCYLVQVSQSLRGSPRRKPTPEALQQQAFLVLILFQYLFTMSERSATKRKHSTPPSPPKAGTSEAVSISTTKRPLRKKGKKGSTDGDRLEYGSTARSSSDLSHQARTLPAETGRSLPGSNTSVRDASILGASSATRQNTRSTNSEATSLAVSDSLHRDPIKTGTSYSDLRMLISQNSEAKQQALAMQQSELDYSMDNFFLESLALSPFSFPLRTNMQRAPSNAPWPQNGRLEMPFTPHQQGNMSDMPTTASTASTYSTSSPAVQHTPHGQQRQSYQYLASSLSSSLQQAYSVPTEVTATIPAHSQTIANTNTSIQQDHPSTEQNMPVGYPQSIPQSTQSGPSSLQYNFPAQSAISAQPIASPARANIPLQLGMNVPPTDHRSAVLPQSISDLSARQQAQAMSEQQTQASDLSAHQRGVQQQDFVVPQYHDDGANYAKPVPNLPQQTTQPQYSQMPPDTSTQQRVHPHRQPRVTQQLTSIPPSITLEPPPQPNAYSDQMTPIEPRALSEQYLWMQLETAQLTMVGTLTDLVVRTRNGQADLDVQDRQVRNVTVNLINVMSLWYLLRRDRGWPL